MRYYYGKFDGSDFPVSETLFGFDGLTQFIIRYGEQAMRAIEQMLREPRDPEQAAIIERMFEEGMLERDAAGKLRLTPRAVSRMQIKALGEVFRDLSRGRREGHAKLEPGLGGERIEGTRAYQYGDDVSEIDLHATLGNALRRHGLPGRNDDGRLIRIAEHDFEMHLHEGCANCSTVVLLDMSGSMMRSGRFLAAKKVALAMQWLVRGRFAQDTLDFIGFFSGAERIVESSLPLVMPKPVTVFDQEVRMRVSLDRIHEAPQHFTNLHLGLQMARRLLKRRGSENRQILIITDGQPTAHVEGQHVLLLYPPDERSAVATLKEAALAARDGIRMATFALIDDYWGMEWVGFVEQMARLTKGIAFYTNSESLASCVMESYLAGRRKKTFVS